LAGEEHDALARSLPSWEPFPDVRAALEDARARGWKLAILSNTDRDYIDASLERIGVPFDHVIVASEIGSYKPAHRHWQVFDEEQATGHPSRIQVEDLLSWLTRVDLAADTWLFEEDGELVAFGWQQPPLTELSFAVGVVHPAARGRGLGSALVELGEQRAR